MHFQRLFAIALLEAILGLVTQIAQESRPVVYAVDVDARLEGV